MQVSSDVSPGPVYFVATRQFLGDKRTAYAQQLQFSLSTFNASAPTSDVTTHGPGDDVIIRGVYAGFSLVARLPYAPRAEITPYTVRRFHQFVYFKACTERRK